MSQRPGSEQEHQSTDKKRNNEPVGIPGKFKDATIRGFHFSDIDRVPKWYGDQCREFALGNLLQNCLLLCGNTGNGKTYLASAVLQIAFIRNNQKCLFITAGRLFALFNSLTNNHKNKFDIIDHILYDYDMLCIDGLEKRNFSDPEKENMFTVINEAYANKRKLIITTQLFPEEFKEIDQRIYSRLCEMSLPLLFIWDDYRLLQKAVPDLICKTAP